jgi:hypothetical protein
MNRFSVFLAVIVTTAACAKSMSADMQAAPRWEVLASCAAAYKANWRSRLADPSRPPSMAAMIHDEFEEYRQVAIAHYEKDQRASKDEAGAKVDAHVNGKIEEFIAMDRAGKLDAFIENCPQPEEPN